MADTLLQSIKSTMDFTALFRYLGAPRWNAQQTSIDFINMAIPVLKLEANALADLHANKVRIRVQAMSLNRADLLWMTNTYIEVP